MVIQINTILAVAFSLLFAGGPRLLVVEGLASDKGKVLVAIFNKSAGFPSESNKAVLLKEAKAIKGRVEIPLDNLPAGTYAIACFHDANADGELNTNLLGIPKERYGFSNNARPGFRAPTYAEASVYLPDNSTVFVKLK
jgi:uncharacterized protein (DUF2141 family)